MAEHFLYYIPPQHAGLYLYVGEDNWQRKYLPCSLTGIQVKASIVDSVSKVVLSQTFTNDHADSVHEAFYRFPLYEGSAVCDFVMEHDGRRIKGIVKPEEEAIKTYEEAKSKGKTAALVLQNAPDIFQTKVGNIPPKASVTVTLTYITPLKHDTELNALRFTLPMTIAPRYGDASTTGSSNVRTLKTGFEFNLNARMPGQITSVSSPSHPITMSLIGTTSAGISLSNSDPVLDKDLVVLVASKDIGNPHCTLETNPTTKTKCAMVTLVPNFNLPRVPTEIIFIIDRSGSMYDKINTVRKALQIFLKSLPASPEVYFNICSFGSNFNYLFTSGKSKKYDAKTLKTAEDYVAKLDSNMGGTKILQPILDCIKKRRTDCQTTIILLTDGEVYNTSEIISAISLEKAKHLDKPLRVFSLGIGDAVSHHLVEGIARAGGGYSQFVTPQERLDKKVVRMLSSGLQSALNNFHLDWPGKHVDEEMSYKLTKAPSDADFDMVEIETKVSNTFFDPEVDDTTDMKTEPPPEPPKVVLNAPAIQQFPEQIPTLYSGSSHISYVLFPPTVPTPRNITLKATKADGTTISLDIPVTEYTSEGEVPTIHTLAARTLLGELEEARLKIQQKNTDESDLADAVKAEGTRIALKYNLASKWTAFVAVDESANTAFQSDAEAPPRMMEDTLECADYDLECFSVLPKTAMQSPSYSAVPPPPPAPLPAVNAFRIQAQRTGAAAPRRKSAAPGSWGASFGVPSSSLGSLGPFGGFGSGRDSSKAKKVRAESRFMSYEPDPRSYEPTISDHSFNLAKEAVMTDEDKLHAIVRQQTSNGAFPANATLAQQIGFKSLKDVIDKLPTEFKSIPSEIWMTVLVCVFLEVKLSGEKDAWELVVEKAWDFIQASVGKEKTAGLKKAAAATISA